VRQKEQIKYNTNVPGRYTYFSAGGFEMAEKAEAVPTGIGTFVWLSWYSAYATARKMPFVFIACAVLLALCTYGIDSAGTQILSAGLLRSDYHAPTVAMALSGKIALIFADSILLAPVAVAVHRNVILNDVPKQARDVLHRRVLLFACWLFGLQLFSSADELAALVFGTIDNRFLIVVYYVVVFVVSLRCALIFPAVAVEAPSDNWRERFKESWSQTRGHFWRLFFVTVLTAFPLVLIAFVVVFGVVLTLLDTSIVGPIALLPLALFGALSEVTAIALGAGVASWIYLWALDHPYEAQSEPAR
jgi:hypothetical protein